MVGCLKLGLVAAETREVWNPTMARSKKPPQPAASRSLLHSMTWSSGCRLGQLDPRAGLGMPPRRSSTAPCGSQTLFGAASPWKHRRGTTNGTHFFGGPRLQSSTNPLVAIPVVRRVSGLSGPDPGGARARFSSQSMGSCLMILSQPVLARRKRRGSGPRAPALSRPCCPSAVSDVCARSVTVQVPQHRHLHASAHVHAAGGVRVRAGPGPHAARGRIGRRIVPELSTLWTSFAPTSAMTAPQASRGGGAI